MSRALTGFGAVVVNAALLGINVGIAVGTGNPLNWGVSAFLVVMNVITLISFVRMTR